MKAQYFIEDCSTDSTQARLQVDIETLGKRNNNYITKWYFSKLKVQRTNSKFRQHQHELGIIENRLF